MTNDVKPLISVVMRAYNVAPYIGEAIESVLRQTYSNFELVIALDVSTDDTEEIVHRYQAKDTRLKVVSNTHGLGAGHAANAGLAAASGEYIAIMDADDVSRPQRLQLEVDFLNRHPAYALVGGGFEWFDERGPKQTIHHPSSCLEIGLRSVTNTFFGHSTVMFRRSVLDVVGTYPNIEGEDYAFLSRITRHFRSTNLSDIVVNYRDNHASLTYTQGAVRIGQRVKETSRENYAYYLGSDRGFEDFFAYQHDRRLRLREWPTVERDNAAILRQLAVRYGLSTRSREYLAVRLKVLLGGLLVACGIKRRPRFMVRKFV
jgi:glycosyltransferase involved in cell wall biosynthesis